ncbi:MAG: hypothetical protein AAF604_04630 [Acidobacteriota bacterium]
MIALSQLGALLEHVDPKVAGLIALAVALVVLSGLLTRVIGQRNQLQSQTSQDLVALAGTAAKGLAETYQREVEALLERLARTERRLEEAEQEIEQLKQEVEACKASHRRALDEAECLRRQLEEARGAA